MKKKKTKQILILKRSIHTVREKQALKLQLVYKFKLFSIIRVECKLF